MKKLNILVIPTTDWIGHPVLERQHQIFERLAKKHNVHVLRFRYTKKRNLSTKTVVYEIDDYITNSLATYYLINAVKHKVAIKNIVRTKDIDIVVLSNLLPAFTSIGMLRKYVRTVFDLSDHFPTSASGYLFDVSSTFGKITSFGLETILRYTLTRTDCTVACSSPLEDYARMLGVSNVKLIPNGVDTAFFSQKYSGEKISKIYGFEDSIVIGFVGMIEFWLDMVPLLKAIAKLKKRYRIKLFLVGKPFQSATEMEIRHKISELKIRENVVWTDDWIQYSEIPDYIASMDLCVIPFEENHPTAYFSAPNKLWEYLALGKPVLATPLPDIMRQAKDFVTFVSTMEDYVIAIENYIKNPELYRTRASKAYKIIKKRSWDKISQNYEQLLKTILLSPRAIER